MWGSAASRTTRRTWSAAGCARGLALLLQDRLEHELFFPDAEMVKSTIRNGLAEGVMMPCVPSWLVGLGGYPESGLDSGGEWTNLVNYEEFMDSINTLMPSEYKLVQQPQLVPEGPGSEEFKKEKLFKI